MQEFCCSTRQRVILQGCYADVCWRVQVCRCATRQRASSRTRRAATQPTSVSLSRTAAGRASSSSKSRCFTNQFTCFTSTHVRILTPQEQFLSRKGFAFNADRPGMMESAQAVFKSSLQRVDCTFQNLDSSEISLTDVSHYFDSDPTKVPAISTSAYVSIRNTAYVSIRNTALTRTLPRYPTRSSRSLLQYLIYYSCST